MIRFVDHALHATISCEWNLTEMQVQYQPMGPLQFSIAGFSPDSTTRLGLAKSREPFVV